MQRILEGVHCVDTSGRLSAHERAGSFSKVNEVPVKADKLLHCRSTDWRVRERFSNSIRGVLVNEPTAGKKNLASLSDPVSIVTFSIHNMPSKLDGNTQIKSDQCCFFPLERNGF